MDLKKHKIDFKTSPIWIDASHEYSETLHVKTKWELAVIDAILSRTEHIEWSHFPNDTELAWPFVHEGEWKHLTEKVNAL